MGDVKKKFAEGKYSCVVGNGEVYAFSRPGVEDLLDLYRNRRPLLKGALVADRVVGRAAASILAMAGISELYAETISRPALEMLDAMRIEVSCGKVVAYIKNRAGDGICPMEAACRDAKTPAECLEILLSKAAAK